MSILLINGSPRRGVTYSILKQLNDESAEPSVYKRSREPATRSINYKLGIINK